jgi:hypothetical protein
MSLVFTPPKEEANKSRYASYVVGSGLKVHGRVVDAKNSWRNRGWTSVTTDEVIGKNYDDSPRYRKKRVTLHGFILENVDGTWYKLYEIKPGLTEEELPWMKEYLIGGWYNKQLYTEFHRTNDYWKQRIAEGKYTIEKRATPMTTDEYVAWRLEIAKENYMKGSDY